MSRNKEFEYNLRLYSNSLFKYLVFINEDNDTPVVIDITQEYLKLRSHIWADFNLDMSFEFVLNPGGMSAQDIKININSLEIETFSWGEPYNEEVVKEVIKPLYKKIWDNEYHIVPYLTTRQRSLDISTKDVEVVDKEIRTSSFDVPGFFYSTLNYKDYKDKHIFVVADYNGGYIPLWVVFNPYHNVLNVTTPHEMWCGLEQAFKNVRVLYNGKLYRTKNPLIEVLELAYWPYMGSILNYK